jgi:hypothetical protein
MAQENRETKKTAETIGEMLREFGIKVGEILDDPEVKAKGKAFAESIVDAAAKVTESKVKDEEVRARIRNIGKAAETLGSSLDKHFKNTGEKKG